jgi:hypothetical protein
MPRWIYATDQRVLNPQEGFLNRLHFLETFNLQVVNALTLVESNVLIAGHHRGEGGGWRCLGQPLTGVTGREIQPRVGGHLLSVLRVNQG